MILPFITPNDSEVFNLFQMVKWKQLKPDRVCVTFTGGVERTFTGTAAKIVIAEILFAVNTYRAFQKGIQSATTERPLIIPPDFTGGPIN